MKTSNKLLIGLYTAFLLAVACFLIAAKSSMIELEKIDGSGNVITKNFGTLTDGDIRLTNESMGYQIDPNSNQVKVEAEDNVLEVMQNIVVDGKFVNSNIYGHGYNINTTVRPMITIGTKDLDVLNLQMRSFTSLSALDTLKNNSIRLDMGDHSQIESTIDCDRLVINARSFAGLTLYGATDFVLLNSRGHARLTADGLSADEWEINMSSFANASVHCNDVIGGTMRDQSSLDLHGQPENIQVTNMNNSSLNNH